MKRGIVYWLRWLTVVPGAVLAGLLATIPMRYILWKTLTEFIEPYPELPERILTPFVICGVCVIASSRIAPEYKKQTALVVFASLILMIGGIAFVGLYVARKQKVSSENNNLQTGKSQHDQTALEAKFNPYGVLDEPTRSDNSVGSNSSTVNKNDEV